MPNRGDEGGQELGISLFFLIYMRRHQYIAGFLTLGRAGTHGRLAE